LDVDMLAGTAAEEQERIITDIPGLKIELLEPETGYGFGLAEILTVVVSVGTGVTSDLAAASIRDGIKAVIRRVRGSKGEADGTQESIKKLIDREREDHAKE